MSIKKNQKIFTPTADKLGNLFKTEDEIKVGKTLKLLDRMNIVQDSFSLYDESN